MKDLAKEPPMTDKTIKKVLESKSITPGVANKDSLMSILQEYCRDSDLDPNYEELSEMSEFIAARIPAQERAVDATLMADIKKFLTEEHYQKTDEMDLLREADSLLRRALSSSVAACGDEDGPGEEDGPWAEGWAERAGLATGNRGLVDSLNELYKVTTVLLNVIADAGIADKMEAEFIAYGIKEGFGVRAQAALSSPVAVPVDGFSELRELYKRLEKNEVERVTNSNYLLSAALKNEQFNLLCSIAGHAKALLDSAPQVSEPEDDCECYCDCASYTKEPLTNPCSFCGKPQPASAGGG